ncbi:hypothetical protein Vi05172_g8603 [Venturia inaequalis]|nr:hypothetical protein Vi05172_g8603 [Venturia inaequalis]
MWEGILDKSQAQNAFNVTKIHAAPSSKTNNYREKN